MHLLVRRTYTKNVISNITQGLLGFFWGGGELLCLKNFYIPFFKQRNSYKYFKTFVIIQIRQLSTILLTQCPE